MGYRPLYHFLKYYVPIGLWFFYNKIQRNNLHLVPKECPVIFAINHQNAFMDALVVAVATKRKPWFMTRASIFKSPVARYWLNALQMIPIFRFRDGLKDLKRNDETMDICINLLNNNKTILIFPEGDHNRKWNLRPLLKGISRMSFGAEASTGFQSNLHIVPLGLQYEDHLHSSSDLLINFGEAIRVADYQQRYNENPALANHELLEELRKRLSSLIIDIHDVENHNLIKNAVQNRPNREKNLVERLHGDQQLVTSFKQKDHTLKVTKKQSLNTTQSLLQILAFPLYLVAYIPHVWVILTIRWMVKRFVRDDHWTASIKFAGLIIIAPLIYGIQLAVLSVFFPFSMLLPIYLIGIPITGLFVKRYRKAFIKT